jgi:Ca-activated chloride channel family protein
VVVVLDTSLSMSAEDLTPSRLTQAKHAVGSLLDRLAGDRVALVTFAGQARRNCPLTVDHGAVRLFLDSLQPDAVAVPGTALADALRAAAAALRVDSRGMDDRGRAIVLLSDGEDHEGDVDTVLTELERSGIPVYALGFGTPRGAPIPLRDAAGLLAGYKRDAEDKVVTTRLAEEVLERVALETRGRYWRATAGEEEVEEIGRSLGSLSRGEIGADLRSRYEERFRIPLLLAWLALVVETVLGDRRRGRRTVAEPAGRQVV